MITTKSIKATSVACILLAALMCLPGCSGGNKPDRGEAPVSQNSVPKDSPTNSPKGDGFDFNNIDWTVEQGIRDGERYVFLSFTNNSNYTLTDLEFAFTEKPEITEEEKTTYFNDLMASLELEADAASELQARPISMSAHSEQIVEPGESVANVNCYYYNGYYYVKNIDHYSLVVPDIATVQYIEDDKIYTVYYDFASNKLSKDSTVETAYDWPQSALGDKLPKPDVKVVKKGYESKSYLSLDVYGLSLAQFNSYVDDCKSLGYTTDEYEHDGYYSAKDSEGYDISLCYTDDNYSMSCTLHAPENGG